MEGILSDGDDFGANAIAGKEGDGIAFQRCGGRAADTGEFRGAFGGGFGVKYSRIEGFAVELQRSRHGQ